MGDSGDDMFLSEEEEYDFEYEDEEEQDVDPDDDVLVQIENKFYDAKALSEDNPRKALKMFIDVVAMEEEKGTWGFKALKQAVKLHFSLGDYRPMLDRYREMLSYMESAVTRNESEKAVMSLLEAVSKSQDSERLREFYEITLNALKEYKNERLWFKTNLKLANLWFNRQEYNKCAKIIKELRKSCQGEDGTDKLKKGTQLLEVYALEIQLYTATKHTNKLKSLYEKSLQVKSGVPHPRIMGVIRECGGKAHLAEGEVSKAVEDFFAAFQNYDEAGSPRRIQCLKYLIITNMLHSTDINVFDSPEVKAYADHPEIVALQEMVSAFYRNDIRRFGEVLQKNYDVIMADRFMRDHIESVLKSLRTQVLLKLLIPYTRITIPFISQELKIPMKDVEALLVSLILDNQISGHIDQVRQMVILRTDGWQETRKYKALDAWAEHLRPVMNAAMQKL